MSEENIEVVRRAIATLGDSRLDVTDDALEEFFDPDVEWLADPQGVLGRSSYVGFDGIRRFGAEFISAWDEIGIEAEDLRGAGDLVVAVLRVRGRMHDVDIDELWSGLYTLRDARILRVQGFISRDGALEAAGIEE